MSELTLHQFTRVAIDKLKLAEYNPRTIDEKNAQALMNSLRSDPEMLYDQPIVVNMYPGREYVVYIGNQRVKAAKELGWQDVPVLLSSVDPVEEKKRNVKANHHNGQFDQELLSSILHDFTDSGMDMTTLGYTADDLTSAMDFSDLEANQDPEYDGIAGKQAKEHTCPQCGYHWKDGEPSKVVSEESDSGEPTVWQDNQSTLET